MPTSKRFVILSGPSCVGKGPLQRAVERFYPEKLTPRPILCTSRPPRAREMEHLGVLRVLWNSTIMHDPSAPGSALQCSATYRHHVVYEIFRELVTCRPGSG